jgi:hypothetical protein
MRLCAGWGRGFGSGVSASSACACYLVGRPALLALWYNLPIHCRVLLLKMPGRFSFFFMAALPLGHIASALVPAEPTITAPAVLPKRQNQDNFIGWLEYENTCECVAIHSQCVLTIQGTLRLVAPVSHGIKIANTPSAVRLRWPPVWPQRHVLVGH